MTDDRPKSAGKRRARRRWPAYLAGAVGLAVFALVGAWLALPGLAERQAEDWLAARGAPDAEIDIATLGLGGATVARLALGNAADDLVATQVTVDYRLNGFAMPTVERVVVRDLRIAVDPENKARPLGALSDLIADLQAQTGGGTFGTIPPVAIESATVTVPSYLGGATIVLSGDVLPDGPQRIAADLAFEAKSDVATLAGKFRFDTDVEATGTARLIVDSGRVLYKGPPLLEVPSISGWLNVAFADATPQSADVTIYAPDVVAAGWPGASLGLEGDYEDGRWSARLATNGSAAGLEGWMTAAGAATSDGPHDLAGELTLEAGAPWWSLLGLPTPSSGSLSVTGDGWIDPEAAILADGSRAPTVAGSLVVQANDLSIDDRIAGLFVSADLDVAAGPRGWSVRAASPLLVTGTPAQGLLDRIGLPANPIVTAGQPASIEVAALDLRGSGDAGNGTAIHADGNLSIATDSTVGVAATLAATLDAAGNLAAIEAEPLSIGVGALVWQDGPRTVALDGATIEGNARMAGRDCAASLTVTAVLASSDFGEASAGDGSVALPIEVACDAEGIELRTADRGALQLRRLRIGGTPYVVDSAALRIEPGATIAIPRTCETPPCDTAIAFAGGLGALAGRADPEGMSFAVEPARLSFDGALAPDGSLEGALDLSSAQFALNDGQVLADDVDARFRFRPGAPTGFAIEIARIENRDLSGWMPILSATADGTIAPQAARFAVHLIDANSAIELDVIGSHGFADGAGSATVDMPPIQFRPGGLQPWDVFPPLAAGIDEATGRVSLDGGIAWNDTGVQSDLALRLEDLSLVTPQADLARINGLVELQSVSPLLSKPDQRVSVALIDIGIPLTNAVVTFAIEPGPRIAISDATLVLADGTVDAAPVTIDPSDTDALIELAVSNMDLSEFLALAAVDGLAATGRLSGTIPVEIRNEDIVIAGARLDASGPGTLSYAPAEAPAGLQGAGETASLVLAALANFRYDTLWLTLDRQPGGETGLGLHVRGSNPDFFDGYPIEFNLSLTGELDRILRDSLVGYRIPDIVQERLESGETTVVPSDETAGEEQ